MPQRQNYNRGRPDNRFRYNGPPGRGGRGGFRPPGGGFQGGPRRDNMQPQHGRQTQQPQNKPNVNEEKRIAASPVNKNESPAIKQEGNVQPLMQKDIPKPAKMEKEDKVGESPKGNPVIPPQPRPSSSTSSAKQNVDSPGSAKTPSGGISKPSGLGDSGSKLSGGNQRGGVGFLGNPNNRRGSNQGMTPPNQEGGRLSGSNQGTPQQQGGRFGGGRGSQERRPQQSRFSSPNPPASFQGEHQGQLTDFGDDLMTEKKTEKKFTGRCRLFIGNLPNETTDEEFKKLFEKFGEINEVFLNKQKMFGFIRLVRYLY